MMNKTLTILSLAAAALLLNACNSKNPATTGTPNAVKPPIERPVIENKSEVPTYEIDARVDILFVIDNSGSMGPHVQNLSRNINKFVAGLAKNKTVDFHIGFTVIHDPTRYGTVVERTCGTDVNWEDPGTLKQLKGPAAPRDGRRYVTKKDDFETALRDSFNPSNPEALKDLVKPFVMPDKANPAACPSGPQEEDSFTPLLNVLNNPVLGAGPNKGFRRDGAFFVAILVSDAKDASNMTPEQVHSQLAQLTGQTSENNKRFRVFAVAMKTGTLIGKGTPNHTQCKPDPAFSSGKLNEYEYNWPKRKISDGENPLSTLAELTQDDKSIDQVLSICDKDFGTTLAKFGTQIQQDTLADITLELPDRPMVTNDPAKKLSVYVGDVRLPGGTDDIPNEERLWSYDPKRVAITVYGKKIDWEQYPNEKLRVAYTPAKSASDTTKPAF